MDTCVFVHEGQPLAQRESERGGVFESGRQRGRGGGVRGAMMSEGSGPTPRFCFHSSVRAEPAAGEPAAGTSLEIAFLAPGPPAPTVPAGGGPPGEAELENRPGAARPGLDPGTCPVSAAPPRRGHGAGSPGARPEAAAQPSPRSPACPAAAARVLDRKAPSDQN